MGDFGLQRVLSDAAKRKPKQRKRRTIRQVIAEERKALTALAIAVSDELDPDGEWDESRRGESQALDMANDILAQRAQQAEKGANARKQRVPCPVCSREHPGQGGAYHGGACPLGKDCCTEVEKDGKEGEG